MDIMAYIKNWRLWAALILFGFWVWRALVAPSPIGLILFATSALLPASGLLLWSLVGRVRTEARERAAQTQAYRQEGAYQGGRA
jgi:hypothetical protein